MPTRSGFNQCPTPVVHLGLCWPLLFDEPVCMFYHYCKRNAVKTDFLPYCTIFPLLRHKQEEARSEVYGRLCGTGSTRYHCTVGRVSLQEGGRLGEGWRSSLQVMGQLCAELEGRGNSLRFTLRTILTKRLSVPQLPSMQVCAGCSILSHARSSLGDIAVLGLCQDFCGWTGGVLQVYSAQ